MITVLSIGEKNPRVKLNLCLTARAFGAAKIIFVGRRDANISKHISAINGTWGGIFKVDFASSVKSAVEPLTKYKSVYLTMFGLPLKQLKYTVKTYKNILLIVTSKEYDKQVGELADFKLSITSQPHSQAAAIAIFLHEFFDGREQAMQFQNAKVKVVPGINEVQPKR